MADKEWTHDELMQLCDAANKLTPDEMRRHIAWFALMDEDIRNGDLVPFEPGDIGCPGLDDFREEQG